MEYQSLRNAKSIATSFALLALQFIFANCGSDQPESSSSASLDGSSGASSDASSDASSGASADASDDASYDVMSDVKNDMKLNEAELMNAPAGVGWAKGAIMGMGNAARGDATPYWWTPDNLVFKSSKTWNAILPWFVLYPGVNHSAVNVRVKVSEMALYVLEKSTGNWRKVNAGAVSPTWASNAPFALADAAPSGASIPRVEFDGLLSYRLDDQLHPIHGGIVRIEIGGDDIGAVFAQLTTQLILDDPAGPDDRDRAQILMSVGVDYYPDMTTKISDYAPMTYNPSVGASRYGLVRVTPRNHYFATIDAIGISSKYSDYLKNGGSVTIPTAQFESNPPPGLMGVSK